MKKYLPTIIVFIVVFVVMYFILGGGIARVQALMKIDKKTTITTTQLMDKLAEQNFGISPYWLDRYQISISSMEDAQADADNDGLTLEQEYLYLTNPFSDDTDGDGYKDGEEIVNGNSPTGNGKLDMTQIAKKHSEESLAVSLDEDERNQDDFDNDGLDNDLEQMHGTDPNKADTDGDGYDDLTEIENGYDPVAPGDVRPTVKIEINKIGVDAPVILSVDGSEEALQKDLESGVVHYPKTAMPGQRGNVYIAGHSSNYSWSTGSYNYIFQGLNGLNVGDKIVLKVKQKNGKTLTYEYEVSEKLAVAADDPRIFSNTQSQVLTLTTCWPVGTNDRRLMIKAYLI